MDNLLKTETLDTLIKVLDRLLDDALFSVDAQFRSGAIESKDMKNEMLGDIYNDYQTLYDYMKYSFLKLQQQEGEKELTLH